MASLKDQLKAFISQNSHAAVHKAMHEIFEEDYSFLKNHFKKEKVESKKKVKVQVPQQEDEVSPPLTQEPEEELSANGLPKITTSTRIKIVKKQQDTEVEKKEDVVEESAEEVVPKPEVKSNKDVKKWQKEQEAKKKVELESKGVDPMTLMTKENLTKWVNEGRTYAYIAREYVGLSESFVSQVGKSVGVHSAGSKRK